MNKSEFWIVVGFGGQFFFFSRFLVQWLVSEKKKQSVIPHAFWYLSVLGGVILLGYAIHRRDPVFIAGQAAALAIYFRNIYWVRGRTGA